MATRHYHVLADPGAAISEHVYMRKSDADDCLDDLNTRAQRADTEFGPVDIEGARVRSCTNGACIGEA